MRCLICFFLVSLAAAQMPAGGKWTLTVVTDKMTDKQTEQFTLPADSEVVDSGGGSLPTLNILCSGSGRFNGAELRTGIVLAVSDQPESRLYKIRVRVDSKFSEMFWNQFADGKTLGLLDPGVLGNKRYITKLLRATDVRIELPTFSGNLIVARFSPSSLDRTMLLKSCGLK